MEGGTTFHFVTDGIHVNLGYKCTQHASSEHATHVVLTK
jgi:hypothetical protein